MSRFILILAVLAAASAVPFLQPEPGDLALILGEDEFEDYLDAWLEIEQLKNASRSTDELRNNNNGCTFRVNGDLGQPQPVYIQGGKYLEPTGNNGQIRLNAGQQVTLACPGNGRTMRHNEMITSVNTGTVRCERSNLVSGGFMRVPGEFGGFVCSAHSFHEAQQTSERCFNNNIVIRVGFIVSNVFYPLYWSCFDRNRLEVLYVWYEQNASNAVPQTGVDRPTWLAGSFYPGDINVNTLYTQAQQKQKIASYVGAALADKYVNNNQFLARGHLAAKTDFVFATGQRSTFYFTNAAPQWQPFNAGNWNWLEQNLRTRIGEAGYQTTVYTGTFGVTQLRDQSGNLVDIYLHHDQNNNPQLPIPLYYYKVVYDSRTRRGTAFVSINNPYYTEAEVRRLTFCTDRCRNNSAFSWLRWQPDRIDLGYSFCCTIDDFRRTIRHLPSFQVNGLLT